MAHSLPSPGATPLTSELMEEPAAHAEQRATKAAKAAKKSAEAQQKAAEQGAIAAAKLFASASTEFRLAAAAEAAKRRQHTLLDVDSSASVAIVGATSAVTAKGDGVVVRNVEDEKLLREQMQDAKMREQMQEVLEMGAWKNTVEVLIAGEATPEIQEVQQQQQVPAAAGIKARVAERKAMMLASSASLQDSRPDSAEPFAEALDDPTPQAAARAWLRDQATAAADDVFYDCDE